MVSLLDVLKRILKRLTQDSLSLADHTTKKCLMYSVTLEINRTSLFQLLKIDLLPNSDFGD